MSPGRSKPLLAQPPRRRFRLTVEALDSSIPVTVRLRKALKALLRAYRLRCEAVEEVR